MISLRDIQFKPTYDSYVDSPILDFLLPALNSSNLYQRAVGYFSSALLSLIPEAFSNFADKGGKIQLICSPSLSYTDANSLNEIAEESLYRSLNRSINLIEDDGLLKQPLDLMAALIRIDCLSLKFAIPYDPDAGMFHQKIGCFSDTDLNLVSFKGSNNESISGWMELRNSEEFDVFTSWSEQSESQRAHDTKLRFEKMWNNNYPGFDIRDFRESLDFIERRSNLDLDLTTVKEQVRNWYQQHDRRLKNDDPLKLYTYQEEVLANWVKENHKGIVCFATGAGKTRTALGAIQLWKSSKVQNSALILVPSIRLQKQWYDEIKNLDIFNNTEVLLVGGQSPGSIWQKALSSFSGTKESPVDQLILAVMDSAAGDAFIDRVQWGNHLLLIADEVHNLGAPGFIELLKSINVGAILGLSATPNRYNDDENQIVRQVFGNDLKPIVDIPFAQDLGVLVQYRYRFETCKLSEDEIDKYNDLTRKVGIALGNKSDISEFKDSRLQLLLIERAKILKKAESKTTAAVNLLRREFKSGDSWLVFCNDTSQLEEVKELISDLRPLTYHQAMHGDPDNTLKLFEESGGILLAIQMLDEGVDIPSIDHCLLIASSQNKRQFIQRRGRVLRANRKYNKGVAEIWDLIVVDEEGYAYTQAEIDRSIEFGQMALNINVINELNKLVRKQPIEDYLQ